MNELSFQLCVRAYTTILLAAPLKQKLASISSLSTSSLWQMKIETRRRLPQSPLNDLESIDHEDFDDDMRGKKSNRFMPYTIVGLILIVISFYFFMSGDKSASQMKLKAVSVAKTLEIDAKKFIRSVPVINEVVPVSVVAAQGESAKSAAIQKDPAEEAKDVSVAVATAIVISKEVLLEQQTKICEDLITKLRELKRSGVVMETDESAKKQIGILQDELRRWFRLQYGDNVSTFRLEMILQFPESMPDYATAGPDGRIIIETAPIELVPYCVYYFLTKVATDFKAGWFHRNAGHVLQAMVTHNMAGGLAFQEYNPGYPHKKLTMGYAGRPGGPAFYISTVDNTGNHGPASQGSKTEADGCFGRVIEGEDVVLRMQKQPGGAKGSGFIGKQADFIKIVSIHFIGIEKKSWFE